MSPTQNYCILVIDDIVDNLILLQFILEAEGYQVELADSGSSAVSRAQAISPDLVLLDVMMPDMNGFEVTQHLRQAERLREMPIVFITADREVCFEQAVKAGADDVVFKPIDLDQLLTRINNWLH
ncbi:response regulator [Stenomitos frigidus]|uniref:Response regulator n=1 Tax=Stenomitos frigidus ULC18 TaxID=2107698 RepID=A0A2T1ENQ3_9CYAN|nr:response regulator [Stenomitos frigidus]PSB34356.1 response regulator [Stenomitos frigidus ULC18]